MWPKLVVAALIVLLAGCSQPHDGPTRTHELAGPGDGANAVRHLAYEHSIEVDTAPDHIAAAHAAGLAACREASAAACTLLESRIDSAPEARATLKFRARPDVIPKLIAAMGHDAQLGRQSTTVEDLSGPIADSARQLAMLDDYRQRLENLRSRAGSDIDALIKVNRELAEVQATFEAADGKRAALARRVETEILNVSIHSDRQKPFWAPIRKAVADFGGKLADGISIAISALAYMLPWLFMGALAAWGVRTLWRRRRARRQD